MSTLQNDESLRPLAAAQAPAGRYADRQGRPAGFDFEAALARLNQPRNHRGASAAFVDRVLAAHREH